MRKPSNNRSLDGKRALLADLSLSGYATPSRYGAIKRCPAVMEAIEHAVTLRRAGSLDINFTGFWRYLTTTGVLLSDGTRQTVKVSPSSLRHYLSTKHGYAWHTLGDADAP